MSSENTPKTGGAVKDRVLAEHRRLDGLLAEACDAFRGGQGSDSGVEAFQELREALEIHFDQEDRLYYPAIRALRPDFKAGLQEFIAEHEKFRTQLENIETLLARADFEGSGRAIEMLAGEFGRHEVSEESVLQRLDRELEVTD